MPPSPAPLLQGTLDLIVLQYSLTAAGRKQLVEQRVSWARFSGALAAILRTT